MFIQNLRFGMRLASRHSAFAFPAVLILALGIGVNTTMFSVMNTLHFMPSRIASQSVFLLVVRKKYLRSRISSLELASTNVT